MKDSAHHLDLDLVSVYNLAKVNSVRPPRANQRHGGKHVTALRGRCALRRHARHSGTLIGSPGPQLSPFAKIYAETEYSELLKQWPKAFSVPEETLTGCPSLSYYSYHVAYLFVFFVFLPLLTQLEHMPLEAGVVPFRAYCYDDAQGGDCRHPQLPGLFLIKYADCISSNLAHFFPPRWLHFLNTRCLLCDSIARRQK